MTTRNVLRVVLPIAVLALGALGAWWLEAFREQPPSEAPPRMAPTVEVVVATPTDLQLSVDATGTVEPATESELVAEVAGRVQSVAPGLHEGAFFAAGDVLVRIDARDYELAVVEAAAEVARAELQLSLEEAEADSARREWQNLGREGEPPALVARQPQLAEARARLAAARAREESAERDLERTTIRAPYDGRCLERDVDLGQFVQRGVRLARVYATAAAEVRLPLSGEQLGYLDLVIDRQNGSFRDARGPHVRLTGTLAGRPHTWEGRIVRTEGRLDPRSRMIHVIARVDDPYAGEMPLLVGMFVEAEIAGRHVENAIVLPRRALLGENRVLVVDEESRLRFRDVDVLRAARDDVVLRDGIRQGERVCVTRLEVVTDGMEVRVAGEVQPEAAAPENGR